jgi:hypothetical protein
MLCAVLTGTAWEMLNNSYQESGSGGGASTEGMGVE